MVEFNISPPGANGFRKNPQKKLILGKYFSNFFADLSMSAQRKWCVYPGLWDLDLTGP